jgi:hypothetical protein
VQPEPSGHETEQSSAPPQLTVHSDPQSTMWQEVVLIQSSAQPPPGQESSHVSAFVQVLTQLPALQVIPQAPTLVQSVVQPIPLQVWSQPVAFSHSSTQPGKSQICETGAGSVESPMLDELLVASAPSAVELAEPVSPVAGGAAVVPV